MSAELTQAELVEENSSLGFDPDEGFTADDGMEGIAPGATQLARVMLGQCPPESLDDPDSPNYSKHFSAERGEDGKLRTTLHLGAEASAGWIAYTKEWERFCEQCKDQINGNVEHANFLFGEINSMRRLIEQGGPMADYVRERILGATEKEATQ